MFLYQDITKAEINLSFYIGLNMVNSMNIPYIMMVKALQTLFSE